MIAPVDYLKVKVGNLPNLVDPWSPYILKSDLGSLVPTGPTTTNVLEAICALVNIDFTALDFTEGVPTSFPRDKPFEVQP